MLHTKTESGFKQGHQLCNRAIAIDLASKKFQNYNRYIVEVNSVFIESFETNISGLKDKINQKNAWLGVCSFSCVFLFSLFLAWAKSTNTTDLTDSGVSSGWAEEGYIALIPLCFVLFKVARSEAVSVRTVLISAVLSVVALVYNNIINKSTWQVQNTVMRDNGWGGVSTSDVGFAHNVGSALGAGFWIGTLSLLVMIVCSFAWALHTTAPAGIEQPSNPQ